MDHRFQYGRSALSSASTAAAKPPAAASPPYYRSQGNAQCRYQMNASKITLGSTCGNSLSTEENLFSLEFKQSSSKEATVRNTLVDEDMSKETESKRTSPSVVAKLMGLDELPPRVRYEQQKNTGCSQNLLSAGFEEKYVSHEDILYQKRTDDHQEFKDVFEIMETSNFEKYNDQPIQKRIPIPTCTETNFAVKKKKVLNVKHFSTDKAPHISKGSKDALDIEDNDEDHFHKCLQEPKSLYTKHLTDLKYSPLSLHPSHNAIPKSSEGNKYGSNEVYSKFENKAESCTYLQNDVVGTCKNPTMNQFCYSLKQHGDTHLYSFPRSRNTGDVDICLNPSQIVVMKPCFDKGRSTERKFPLPRYCGTGQFGYRGHGECWTSGVQDLHAEGRCQQKLFTNAELLEKKTKDLKEVTRENTKQMKNTASNITKKEFASRFAWNVRDKSLRRMVDLNSDETFRQTSNLFDDWNSSCTSSSYSDGSSMNSETTKCLLEPSQTIHCLQRRGFGSGDSYALGEMLGLSDRETSRSAMHSWNAQNALDEKLARDVALEPKDYPLNINSRSDWEGACSIYLPRSIPQLASSTAFRSPKSSFRLRGGNDYSRSYMLKDTVNLESDHPLDRETDHKRSSSLESVQCCSNKPQTIKANREENDTPVREIFVNSEEGWKKIVVDSLAEEMLILSEVSGNMFVDTAITQNSLLSENGNAIVPTLVYHQKQVEQPANIIPTVKDGNTSATGQKHVTMEGKCNDQPHVDSLSSHCDEIDSESLVSLKEVEQPSPVSVLEPMCDKEKYSLGCFRSVAANLEELRTRVELLIVESEDRRANEFEEDAREEDQTLFQMEDIFSAFRDEEDRDFSYLVDMLIHSGIRDVSHDELFDACHSSEYPVYRGVFEKLEKTYGMLDTWSRSQRELLFDLINSSLAELIAPCMDAQPWLGLKKELVPKCARWGLVEELWQMVVRKRTELSVDSLENIALDLSWRNLGDDESFTGREIAEMLIEDILEEFVLNLSWGKLF